MFKRFSRNLQQRIMWWAVAVSSLVVALIIMDSSDLFYGTENLFYGSLAAPFITFPLLLKSSLRNTFIASFVVWLMVTYVSCVAVSGQCSTWMSMFSIYDKSWEWGPPMPIALAGLIWLSLIVMRIMQSRTKEWSTGLIFGFLPFLSAGVSMLIYVMVLYFASFGEFIWRVSFLGMSFTALWTPLLFFIGALVYPYPPFKQVIQRCKKIVN